MRPRPHRLALESLEDRTLLATCQVANLLDVGKGGLSLVSGQAAGDLRFCINQANAMPGPDIIDFDVNGTINLRKPLPDLSSDIHIQGPGADLLAIDAQEKDRVFDVTVGANVEISAVTITNGLVWKGPFLALGGGIQNAGNLLVRNSVISGNTAHSAAFYGAGGGIYNAKDANLTLIDSLVSDNRVVGDELAAGGGICNSGTALIYNSAIVANMAEDTSTIDKGFGAGISNSCPPPGPPISGFLLVQNSTVHSNASIGLFSSDEGIGGIAGGGTVIVSHSTVALNTGWGLRFGSVFMRNSIVAGNSEGDMKGPLASSGYNLIGDSSGGSGFGPTDILDVDPLLGPLQGNGGLTPTAALLPGSPAIDAGDNADAPEFDQRGPGFPRIVNGTIDVGAFEVQSTPVPSAPKFLAFLITAKPLTDDYETIP